MDSSESFNSDPFTFAGTYISVNMSPDYITQLREGEQREKLMISPQD